MKRALLVWTICLTLMALLLLPATAWAQSAASTPRPEKACHICDEGLPEFTPTPLTVTQLVNSTNQQTTSVIIYFFWGDGCPHCAEEKPFLERLKQQYAVEVRAYEVWYVPENQNLFLKMAAAHGFEPSGVPTTFIGKRHWVGYSQQIGQEIEAAVKECLTSGCPDAGAGIITPAQPTPSLPPTPPAITATPVSDPSDAVLDIPLIGAVNLASQSLLVSTALIALVDGFNPCSLWVLSILLALTLHTGSRKKVLIIGLVFLTVTSLVYVLFIAGLFTLFTFISFLGWIQVVVALVALFFAAVNIKDYFWYKEGISFTIDDAQKPGIYKRMRNVLNAGDSLVALVGATVVMSAGVSLVEFACTAGFPVLWTNLLAAHKVAPLAFGLLLALYMLIYQIDELGIFLAAVFTLKSSRLEEKHGRILKLVGGTLMLTLAIVMVVKPALMNNLVNSLVIFGIAFGAAALVLVVHRYILPRWGIVIGTEALAQSRYTPRKKRRK